MGNEAGDLDSVVSAVVWAFHKSGQVKFLPVLNFKRQDLPLRTEVKFCFDKLRLDANKLVCVDDVGDWVDVAEKADVTLVDHHNPTLLALAKSVSCM